MGDKLQKFIAVVESGSFTRAARLLHISQPALSIAIDRLEHELGATLLTRSSKKLVLTEAGKAVYESALDHQAADRHLRARLTQLARKKPSVIVGAIDSVATTLWETTAFSELEQQAAVTLTVNNSRYLRDHVQRGRIDCAFVIDDGQDHPGLDSQLVGEEQLWLVTHPANAGQLATDIVNGKLGNFISYDKPSNTYRHIQAYFGQLDIQTQSSLYSTSPDIMLQMVLSRRGSAILPKSLVANHVKSGELSAAKTDIIRPITLITAKNRPKVAVLDEFLDDSAASFSCQ